MRSLKWIAVCVSLVCAALGITLASIADSNATEAPAGFDGLTNGMVEQDTHDQDRATFEETDNVGKGLGPVFNGTSCATCHASPLTGGGSSVAEVRVGHLDESGNFVNPTVLIDHGTNTISGRSLIDQFATCPLAQESVPASETIRTLRISVNGLGDGFVEAIPDETLLALAQQQARTTGGIVHGEAVQVPVLEAPGVTRVGRFGWKVQHASLLSFAADAYLNEQGVTSRLLPNEITTVCSASKGVEDQIGSEGLADIDHFARFLRATKVPPVDATLAASADAQAGSVIFTQLGCDTCHVRTMTTAAAGTVLNGGTFIVPEALGSKIIHPFSDFLLHDVGTGDGIVQNGTQSTANKLRTPPLWGLRMRTNLMHDGGSTSSNDAILRHAGEANFAADRYRGLSDDRKANLLKFLGSL